MSNSVFSIGRLEISPTARSELFSPVPSAIHAPMSTGSTPPSSNGAAVPAFTYPQSARRFSMSFSPLNFFVTSPAFSALPSMHLTSTSSTGKTVSIDTHDDENETHPFVQTRRMSLIHLRKDEDEEVRLAAGPYPIRHELDHSTPSSSSAYSNVFISSTSTVSSPASLKSSPTEAKRSSIITSPTTQPAPTPLAAPTVTVPTPIQAPTLPSGAAANASGSVSVSASQSSTKKRKLPQAKRALDSDSEEYQADREDHQDDDTEEDEGKVLHVSNISPRIEPSPETNIRTLHGHRVLAAVQSPFSSAVLGSSSSRAIPLTSTSSYALPLPLPLPPSSVQFLPQVPRMNSMTALPHGATIASILSSAATVITAPQLMSPSASALASSSAFAMSNFNHNHNHSHMLMPNHGPGHGRVLSAPILQAHMPVPIVMVPPPPILASATPSPCSSASSSPLTSPATSPASVASLPASVATELCGGLPGTNQRIVIIGGGASGFCLAYAFAQRGLGSCVTVLDSHGIGSGASGHGGGFLAREWCDGSPLGDIARRGFDLHAEMAKTFGKRYSYSRVSTVDVMLSMRKAANRSKEAKKRRHHALPGWLDGAVSRCHVLGTPDNTACIDSTKFTECIAEEAMKHGVKLRIGKVENLVTEPLTEDPAGEQRVVGVQLRGSEVVQCDTVVMAMGAWSGEASNWNCFMPPLKVWKSYSMLLRPSQPINSHAVFLHYESLEGERYDAEAYPRADGLIYVGGISEHSNRLQEAAGHVKHTPEATQLLKTVSASLSSALTVDSEQAAEHKSHSSSPPRATGGSSEVMKVDACYLSCFEDHLPCIGAVPSLHGAYMSAGHAVWSVLNAPVVGSALCDLILNGKCSSVDLSPFNPKRLMRKTLSKPQMMKRMKK